jgi:uncharacterized protein YciI
MNHYLTVYRPPRPTFVDDASDSESTAVGEHFEYLKKLLSDGTLLLAGRTEDASMGLVVFRAPDQHAAEMILRDDPAVQAGVFRAELHRYRLALFAGEQ